MGGRRGRTEDTKQALSSFVGRFLEISLGIVTQESNAITIALVVFIVCGEVAPCLDRQSAPRMTLFCYFLFLSLLIFVSNAQMDGSFCDVDGSDLDALRVPARCREGVVRNLDAQKVFEFVFEPVSVCAGAIFVSSPDFVLAKSCRAQTLPTVAVLLSRLA